MSCIQQPPRKLDYKDVDSVLFGTMPYGVATIAPLSIAQVTHSPNYKDTLCNDPFIIQRFIALLNQLSPSRDHNRTIDCRKIALINMKDGSIRQVGFGDYWDTIYEGCIMNDSDELFQFLDSLLYAPFPPEYWWDEETKEMMETLKNLR